MEKKKERKTLTIEEKIRILEKVDSFRGTRVALARELQLPVSTLNTIVKNRDSISLSASECGSNSRKRKYATYSKYEELEEIVKNWFETSRAAGIPIDGVLLREKALKVANILGIDNFSASNGWIDRFRKRHNITYKTVCGESNAVSEETVNDWTNGKLQELTKNYLPKDIFNLDETGLFFSVLPSKTLAFKGDKCHGGKNSKMRLTVLLGANADGSEKLRPFVIGKSKKPRCFKHVRSLPTLYEANQKAWMTSDLFRQQLYALDARMGAQNRKILVVIDRCPAHPIDVHLRNIQLEFLPSNCTSKLQPMDLGVIHSFKSFYRKSLVQRILCLIDAGKDPESFKVSILDALHFIAKSWKAVKQTTISNCFLKAGFKNQANSLLAVEEEGDLFPAAWERLQPNCSLEDFLQIDDNVVTAEERRVEELATERMGTECSISDDEESEICEVMPTSVEASAAVEVLRRYLSSVEGGESNFHVLYELERQIEDIKNKKSKQTSILDYFGKQQ